jgi:hypothetical protein
MTLKPSLLAKERQKESISELILSKASLDTNYEIAMKKLD